MATWKSEQQVNLTPEEIWAAFSDCESYANWAKGVRESRGDLTAGGQLELRFATLGKDLLSFRVMELHPERQMVWTNKQWLGLVEVDIAFRLKPLTARHTVVYSEVNVFGPGRFLAHFWGTKLSVAIEQLVSDLAASRQQPGLAL